MRQLIVLLFVLILFDITLKGQQINNPIDSTKFTYCEIIGTRKLMNTKVNIEIDFGEKGNLRVDNRLKDPATGKNYVFNSMMDALNFMGKNGWEFVQAYATANDQAGTGYHFLMKKQTSLFEKEN
jgi:hypothetical protein